MNRSALRHSGRLVPARDRNQSERSFPEVKVQWPGDDSVDEEDQYEKRNRKSRCRDGVPSEVLQFAAAFPTYPAQPYEERRNAIHTGIGRVPERNRCQQRAAAAEEQRRQSLLSNRIPPPEK